MCRQERKTRERERELTRLFVFSRRDQLRGGRRDARASARGNFGRVCRRSRDVYARGAIRACDAVFFARALLMMGAWGFLRVLREHTAQLQGASVTMF